MALVSQKSIVYRKNTNEKKVKMTLNNLPTYSGSVFKVHVSSSVSLSQSLSIPSLTVPLEIVHTFKL